MNEESSNIVLELGKYLNRSLIQTSSSIAMSTNTLNCYKLCGIKSNSKRIHQELIFGNYICGKNDAYIDVLEELQQIIDEYSPPDDDN